MTTILPDIPNLSKFAKKKKNHQQTNVWVELDKRGEQLKLAKKAVKDREDMILAVRKENEMFNNRMENNFKEWSQKLALQTEELKNRAFPKEAFTILRMQLVAFCFVMLASILLAVISAKLL